LTEEEMPVSGGELMFALLEEKQKGRFEAEKLALAEEAAKFYKRGCERTGREGPGAAKHVYGVPGVG
jgi:hypothetical protein